MKGQQTHLLEELLAAAGRKVADADVLDKPGLDELLHRAPSRHDVVRQVPVDVGLAVRSLALGERDRPAAGQARGLGQVSRASFPRVEDRGDALHEVQVEVVQLEVLQGVLEGALDLFRLVESVPDCSDESQPSGTSEGTGSAERCSRLEVTQSSLRSIPASLMPCPTSASFL